MRVVDTNILSLLLRGDPRIVSRMASCNPDELAITIVNVEEMLNGWHARIRRAKTDEQFVKSYSFLREAVQFAAAVQILDFTNEAVHRFNELKQVHRRTGTKDLRIAAIVLANDATLANSQRTGFPKHRSSQD